MSRFKINKPAMNVDAIRNFAEGANVQGDALLPKNETSVEVQTVAPMPADKPAARVRRKETSTAKPYGRFAWLEIDDAVARRQAYVVQFPATLYAKLKFLTENEPGGPSVRKLVIDALEPHVEALLKKYEGAK